MPHISKKKIEASRFDTLYSEFTESIEKSFRKHQGANVLNEFLTRTEKIMLTKRFALIVLLMKEVPTKDIARTLAMTTATVEKVSLMLESGKFETLSKIIKRQDIWRSIELLVLTTGGLMPPKVGVKRVKQLRNRS
ncbi:MAG: Trp family transcriptional regulator [bacterium]